MICSFTAHLPPLQLVVSSPHTLHLPVCLQFIACLSPSITHSFITFLLSLPPFIYVTAITLHCQFLKPTNHCINCYFSFSSGVYFYLFLTVFPFISLFSSLFNLFTLFVLPFHFSLYIFLTFLLSFIFFFVHLSLFHHPSNFHSFFLLVFSFNIFLPFFFSFSPPLFPFRFSSPFLLQYFPSFFLLLFSFNISFPFSSPFPLQYYLLFPSPIPLQYFPPFFPFLFPFIISFPFFFSFSPSIFPSLFLLLFPFNISLLFYLSFPPSIFSSLSFCFLINNFFLHLLSCLHFPFSFSMKPNKRTVSQAVLQCTNQHILFSACNLRGFTPTTTNSIAIHSLPHS
ncbi:unnamed protein product [Acanthosepion pharaonis]|uniref:Uncharacterized protein n=1 Tax=Acanthosepion pharaonis TaxID=158019 RepID=A0A812ETU4_ACAPH|nr:unnamed protein product [Sepia pharaonis]